MPTSYSLSININTLDVLNFLIKLKYVHTRLLVVVQIWENVPNSDLCGHSVAEMVRNSRIS